MKKLSLVVDMYGCPNRCKHCWLGHMPNHKMADKTDELLIEYFKPYFEKTAYESAFNVLTDTFDADKISLNKINQVINNISAFSGFAEMYTQMLKTAPIGETDTTDNKTEENKTAQ